MCKINNDISVGDKLYFYIESKQHFKKYDILTTTIKRIEQSLSGQKYYIVDFGENEEALKMISNDNNCSTLYIVTTSLEYYKYKCEIDPEYKNKEEINIVRQYVFPCGTLFFVNFSDIVNIIIENLKDEARYYTNCLNDIYRNMMELSQNVINSNLSIYKNNEYVIKYKNSLNDNNDIVESEKS